MRKIALSIYLISNLYISKLYCEYIFKIINDEFHRDGVVYIYYLFFVDVSLLISLAIMFFFGKKNFFSLFLLALLHNAITVFNVEFMPIYGITIGAISIAFCLYCFFSKNDSVGR